jgi:hypothetical protein
MKLSDFYYRLTHWETWSHHAKYVPLSPAWLWYCLRSGSMWFFTPSNPTLTFGGFEGEGKNEMYTQLPPGSYPKSLFVKPSQTLAEIEAQAIAGGISYPFAVKPDVGMSGYMFRIIRDPANLAEYHQAMPFDYIVQELIDYPVEVSVFYYRFPDETKGTITGFLKKEYLQVTGDGKATLSELILRDPWAKFRHEYLAGKHADRINDVIPAGESYRLSSSLNLSQGCRMISLEHEKDSRMLEMFDRLNNYSKEFYYGRYDIKCTSIEDLREGKNFSIMEYNGCGAEPHHIYGNGYTLSQAQKIVLHHWNVLYRISRINHKKGIRYWSLMKGYRFLKEAKKHFARLKDVDAAFPV